MRSLALLLVPVLAGCGSLQVEPFRNSADLAALVEDEPRLWDQSREFDRVIASAGFLHEDEALRAYLQGVLDRLFPEFQGSLRVFVLASPVVNAFTLPAGTVYVHAGALSTLANEAQLATLLAHEGTHFTHRHGARERSEADNAAALATVLSFTGLGLFAGPLAASSLSGFSRDMEREADRVGFERLTRAGYDPREAVATFRRLLARTRDEEEAPFFFASHPALEERIRSYEELAAAAPSGGEVESGRYCERTAAIRRVAIEADLELLDHESVLAALELDDGRRLAPELLAYYRGEALRQRAGEGDLAAARAAFEEALRADPACAPAHRSLGRLLARTGDPEGAREHLTRYLELAPGASDRKHVENELGGIQP